ncbi:hypothetical protein PVOR_07175 [Paenibacillus vortex V453]|uniref:Uncharacterized protein n=1 Tax=Paenibacillus vortex V453 TaxID=715225 RepID=A0A2R9SZ08_9BACL|nr:hypothetical protein PVOR_07175 [Paenibacillus vortex V453]
MLAIGGPIGHTIGLGRVVSGPQIRYYCFLLAIGGSIGHTIR